MKPQDCQRTRCVAPGLLLAAVLQAVALPAVAADPPLQMSQRAHTSWTARDGTTLGLVLAMAQTPDGYLWVAGSFGLFRFDGLRFMPWTPPDGQALPSSAYSLLVSRDGTLWIGTYSGLSSWDGQRFVRRHPEIGLGFVTSLLEDREGTVWAGVHGKPGRLCAIRKQQVQCSPADDTFGDFVWSLAEDPAGQLWVGAESGVWRWRPGPPKRHALEGRRIGDLSATAEGPWVAASIGAGLLQRDGERLRPYPIRRAGHPDETLAERDIKANKLLRDRDGGLWIGTEGLGLLHVKDGVTDSFTRAEGLSGNIACSLFEDREGNVWYGSERGLDRFSKLPVTTISTRQGLPDDVSRSVLATSDGSVWAATNGGLARWTDGRLTVYGERDGLPHARVHSQYEDAQGRYWVSTAGGLAYFANGRFVPVASGPSTEIYAMAGDEQGNLWLSGNQGLTRLQQGRLVETLPWAALERQQQAQVIVADRGGLWMAFWDGSGVSFVKDGQIEESYAFPHLPGHGAVTHLRRDAEGAIWASTLASGLHRILGGGRVTSLSEANGLPCNTVHWSIQDAGGALWMYTACGLVRVGADDLKAWMANPAHRVKPQTWGAAEGVPLTATPSGYFNPAVTRRPDGKLWFIAGADLQVIDPARIHVNKLPPPVHIRSVVADHNAYPVSQGLHLPPMVRDLAIEFVSLSLVDPRSTRFRYRLEGHGDDWHEVTDMRTATYTNLPPGNYRFHVKAANNSGVWNEDGAQLAFVVEPALHQTLAFRLGVALLLALVAWGGFRLWLDARMRRLHRRFEATLEARVSERTRIARDLHDTLLQHFQGLLLQFQAAFNLLPGRPAEARQVLEAAIDGAAAAITEGRDTVQGLRSAAPQPLDLVQGLQALAGELTATDLGGTALQVHTLGRPQALRPPVLEETLRIAGEALRNAVHHAAATQVHVEVHYEARQLRVCVRDNGSGIDAEVLRTGGRRGHFGLRGMRERAELVGGRLQVRSKAGTGTEVEFSVRASRAYIRSKTAWPWRRRGGNPSKAGA